jgi:uncharacterized protein YdhG (YjbR/CyaY superfamily)
MPTKAAKNVDAYIASAPKEVRGKLTELRAAIKSAAPKAEEKISYGMPYYSYKGRLAYFSYAKHHIGLYAMPPIVQDHAKELKKYKTATATIRFPLNEKLPIALIKKLVRAGVRNNDAKVSFTSFSSGLRPPKVAMATEGGKKKVCSRGHVFKGSGPCPTCWPALRQRLRRGTPGRLLKK